MTTAAAAQSSAEPIKVNVGLGERAYDIMIGRGLLAGLGERIAKLRPGAKAVIVTDATVAKHHLAATQAALKGLAGAPIVVPAGEASKSFDRLQEVCDAVLAARIERGDLIVALGGGVVGDLAGFAASVVRRGIDFVQVPTTLLAQVDSSVGGKTGINTGHGKNLIGAFHQPILVIADTALLDTLPEREFRAGYAEVVKYGLLGDREFFEWLEANWRDVFKGGPARGNQPCATRIRRAQERAGQGRDRAPRRARDRRPHAAQPRPYLRPRLRRPPPDFSDKLLHGEAIGLGMALAFEFSARRGPDCQGRRRARRSAIWRRSACPPISRRCAAPNFPSIR
jgi:3-dehydroquinate synthetase